MTVSTADPELPVRAALLLDLDGTLLDIAPTPAAVVVPSGLLDALSTLRDALGGALAVVSGRPVEQVDALLDAAPYAVAGEHGGAIRPAPGAALERLDLPGVPAGWLERAERAAAGTPGVLLERKAHGFALHFRLAPAAGPALHQVVLAMLADGGAEFTVMPGRRVWEVLPRGADKGRAVHALMARPPFAGRVPVYVGDDVTDEDGIRAARELGGLGLKVQDRFGDAAGVREWLGILARSHFS
ncbi:MAG: trehalose-phosphatase [Desulfobaccales bacterium]